MVLKWLSDCVVNVEINGELITLYQGVEFECNNDHPYIKEAIAAGHCEILLEE